jgi:hypothetical protein
MRSAPWSRASKRWGSRPARARHADRAASGEAQGRSLDYYNHNLDTSPEFYGKIITTRTYDDRLETLEHVRTAGIHVCCGGNRSRSLLRTKLATAPLSWAPRDDRGALFIFSARCTGGRRASLRHPGFPSECRRTESWRSEVFSTLKASAAATASRRFAFIKQ